MSPTRRHFLQALGLASGSLALPSLSLASTATPARRIIFFITGHGTVYDNWRMRPGGLPEDQDWEADLTSLAPSEWSPILAPLAPHASKLLVLDGLGHAPSIVTGFNEHEEGAATCLTGSLPVEVVGSQGIAASASLDQILAANRGTPFRSLEYEVRGRSFIFDALGQRLPVEGNLNQAWDRLFPSGTSPGGPLTTADRVNAYQSRMVDQAIARFDALLPRLGSQDRQKIESHRDLLRDLEAQLVATDGLVCDAPDDPNGIHPWYDPLGGTNAFQDMIVAAMSCGLTDIATLMVGDVRNEDIGAPPGNLHNDFAHNTLTDPGAAAVMTDYHTWYATRFKELLDKLDAIPEGNGTMLDHTLCVWTNELANGSHHHTNMPIVVAGGTEVFNTGRIVRWAPQYSVQGPWSAPTVGQPHNKLLVTLAQAMGESLQQVGMASVDLAGGGVLDCTGALDRVCL